MRTDFERKSIMELTLRNYLPIDLSSLSIFIAILALIISVTTIIKINIFTAIESEKLRRPNYGLQSSRPTRILHDHVRFIITFTLDSNSKQDFQYCGHKVELKAKNIMCLDSTKIPIYPEIKVDIKQQEQYCDCGMSGSLQELENSLKTRYDNLLTRLPEVSEIVVVPATNSQQMEQIELEPVPKARINKRFEQLI